MEYKNDNAIDGITISLLGSIGIKNIEFWLYLEQYYLENIIEKEEPYRIIECLVGLAMAKRG